MDLKFITIVMTKKGNPSVPPKRMGLKIFYVKHSEKAHYLGR